MGQMRHVDKKGNIKYVSDNKGNLFQVKKDGTLGKNIVKHEDTGKSEEVKIDPKDLK